MAPAGIGADVEGLHAVGAAVAAGRVERLIVERTRSQDERIAALADRVRGSGGIVELVDDVRPYSVTTAPQGVVARCRTIKSVDLEDAMATADPPALVILDHVVDPRNVGAIARSAVAAGIGALVVSLDRAAPMGPSAFKAAAGALEVLPVAVIRSVADAVRLLEERGVWTVGLDGSSNRSLLGLDLLQEPVALVIGSEGRGLSRLVGERVSVKVQVPMLGGVESLNASVAASLAMFELARARGWVT